MNKRSQRHLIPAAIAAALLSLSAATVSAQDTTEEAAGVVNIQTATSDQLQLLPGIGPTKAQAIVTYREGHAFRRVEDIMRVRGVGRATFRRLRPMLTVEGPTTMVAPPARASRAAGAPEQASRAAGAPEQASRAAGAPEQASRAAASTETPE